MVMWLKFTILFSKTKQKSFKVFEQLIHLYQQESEMYLLYISRHNQQGSYFLQRRGNIKY